MPTGDRQPVTSADLTAAVTGAVAAFRDHLAGDWAAPARDLDWSCAETLTHIHQALWFYAGQTATAGNDRRPRMLPTSPDVATAVDALPTSAAILRSTAAGLAGRAWHGSGMADAEGFLAMACDEVMVHTWDITAALGGAYRPPAGLSSRVVARLFPWAPDHGDPSATLLWCNGRIDLGDRSRLGDDWDWHCAPLDEWDGSVPDRIRR